MRFSAVTRLILSAQSFALFFLALFLASAFPASAEDIKAIHPTGYVTDLAVVLTPDAKARLENLCAEVEQKTGAQMAIVTVRSLEGETAGQYGNELFKQLGIGSKKDDRGILLLVAPGEHKYWTEVGYGLEPVVTDARAGDAGRAMIPFFRQNNFSAGIEAAASQLANYIAADRGVTLSGAQPTRPGPYSNDRGPDPLLPIGILLFVVLPIFAAIRRFISSNSSRRGPRGGGSWWIGPTIGGMMGGSSGGWGGSSGGWGGGGGGFGGFGGGSSGGGGAGGSW